MKFFQKNLHEHEDGTVHTHKHHGPHTHDENGISHDLPDFESMTKKDLGKWAEDHNIIVDEKKTKPNMIEEIKKKL